jgi:predicted transcriptional regulator of viral defense system
VTLGQVKPAVWNHAGIICQFVKHDSTRFFGYSSIWINPLEKAMVSDLEKTIVDICTKPKYAGDIVVLGKAIIKTKDRTDQEKLFYYLARNGNKSARKRFLYLVDLLGMEWTGEHERLLREIGKGTSLLDPLSPDKGTKLGRFGLKINVDPAHIKRSISQF